MLSPLLVLGLSVLLAPLAAQDAPTAPAPPASTITRVVVIPKHAEITREIQVQAAAGENTVRFTNLVPILNPHTLRASASSGARITGTELRTSYLKEGLSEEIAALDLSILALKDDLAQEGRAQGRLTEEAAFYGAIKTRLTADVERELARGTLGVDEWRQVLAFVGEGLAGCDTRFGELAGRLRDKQRQLAGLEEQRKDYSTRQTGETKEILVSFSTDAPGPQHIAVHYIIDAVAWVPSYDVHLDRERGDIEVVGYGQIAQWSGEHWTDVQLALAMSRPDFELTVPDLAPMLASLDDKEMAQLAKEVSFLSTSARDQAEKWSAARFKRSQERETYRRNLEQLSQRSDQHLAQYGLNQALIQGAMTRLVDRFAGVRYDIASRESIPCDSSAHKVVIFRARVPARLKYVATPALGATVMLQGEIVNTTGVPMLAGGAALFIDDSYVGAGQVAAAAKNEPLDFGFGPDDSLVVTRKLLAREVKGPEAFRQSQVLTYRYEIRVENFNSRGVEVEVADQIPVSKSADIAVSFLDSTHTAGFDAQDGSLRWSLEIGAGATSTIAYSFSVECPVGREVYWL